MRRIKLNRDNAGDITVVVQTHDTVCHAFSMVLLEQMIDGTVDVLGVDNGIGILRAIAAEWLSTPD